MKVAAVQTHVHPIKTNGGIIWLTLMADLKSNKSILPLRFLWRVGVWKLLGAGLLLQMIYLGLLRYHPEMPSHHPGSGPAWGKVFVQCIGWAVLWPIANGFVKIITPRTNRNVDGFHPALLALVLIAYFVFSLWVLSR